MNMMVFFSAQFLSLAALKFWQNQQKLLISTAAIGQQRDLFIYLSAIKSCSK